MPSTTSFKFGEIVLVRFPFTDQHGSKQCPAVVISSHIYNQKRADVVLMAITSQIRKKLTDKKVEGEWWGKREMYTVDGFQGTSGQVLS